MSFFCVLLATCLLLSNVVAFQTMDNTKKPSAILQKLAMLSLAPMKSCHGFNSLRMSKDRNNANLPVPTQLKRYEIINEEIQEMFPRITYANLYQDREYPDFEKLAPDDPLFLDMPWPSERGPAASAFARHLQWKRRLSDGERLKWQKWAIYKRMAKADMFSYRVDDYIMQQLLRDLRSKELNARTEKDILDATLWKATQLGLLAEERDEVEAVMKSFYSILNHRNYDEVRTLWLPDPDVQLTLPGFEKTSGHFEIEKLFRRVMKEAKPLAQISARTAAIHLHGYLAVVHTVESMLPGNDRKPLRKRGTPAPKPYKGPPPKVLATTVLRKFNEQWRIMSHHAVPYSASTSLLYCDEKLEVMDTLQRRSTASSLAFSPPAGGEEVGVGLGAGGAAEKDFRTALNEFVNYKNSQKAGSDASGFSSGSISGGTSNSASSGAVTDSSGLWRKLQGLMEESGPNTSGSMTTRRNSEGGVERVIDLAQGTNPAITAYEKGGIFQDSSGEEVGGSSSSIIESLVLQSAKDIFGPGVEFKRGKNGEMTLQRTTDDSSKEKQADVNDDDDDDDLNEDEGIVELPTDRTKINSLGSRGAPSAGVAVVSNPLYSGQSVSTSKKTAQALRFLQKTKRLPPETKNLLLLDMIDCAARERISLVETSFELLVLDHFKGSPEDLYAWRPTTFDTGMDEFLDQCMEVATSLRAEQALSGPTIDAGTKKSTRKKNVTPSVKPVSSRAKSKKSLTDSDSDDDDDDSI